MDRAFDQQLANGQLDHSLEILAFPVIPGATCFADGCSKQIVLAFGLPNGANFLAIGLNTGYALGLNQLAGASPVTRQRRRGEQRDGFQDASVQYCPATQL